MPKYEPVIKIDKDDAVGYRILNGLSKNREYVIVGMDSRKENLLKNIGKSTSSFNVEYPVVWHTANRGHREKRLLKLPPNIEINEEQGNGKIFFKFKRRRII